MLDFNQKKIKKSKIGVLCLNKEEYDLFLQKNSLKNVDFYLGQFITKNNLFFFIESVDSIKGINMREIRYFGNWKLRGDLMFLEEELKFIFGDNFKINK